MNRPAPVRTGLAALALTFNAFLWGLSWWPLRELQGAGVHPLWASALVFGTTALLLGLLWPQAWRPLLTQRNGWLLMLASGLCNAGFNWAVTVGDVVRVVLLFYLMPVWSLGLAWLLLGERPHGAALLRLLLALVGVSLVLQTPDSVWPLPRSASDWLALLAGLFFALTNIQIKRLEAAPSSVRMLAMFVGSAVLTSLLVALGSSRGWVPALPPPQPYWILITVLLGLMFWVGNMALQYGAARLRAGPTALIMLSEVVFASASAIWLDASALELRTVIGGGLIVLAAALATRDNSAA